MHFCNSALTSTLHQKINLFICIRTKWLMLQWFSYTPLLCFLSHSRSSSFILSFDCEGFNGPFACTPFSYLANKRTSHIMFSSTLYIPSLFRIHSSFFLFSVGNIWVGGFFSIWAWGIRRKCPDCPDVTLHQEHEHFPAVSGSVSELTILKAKIWSYVFDPS